MGDIPWHLTMLLASLAAVPHVGAWRPNYDSSPDTSPTHVTLGHAAVSQQTLDVANSAKEWTQIENDKKRSLLSTREEDDGTGMVGKKKDKDKIKNKPGAFCPIEGLDKHDEDSRGHLFDWGSKKQKSKLILTVPHGHNFPRLPGHYGFSTDIPDIFVKLHIQIGSDSYSARTSVE